ncbi:MAG: nucleotidyl transferase AbiEii/AbiGii toxin family protein [bacterium]
MKKHRRGINDNNILSPMQKVFLQEFTKTELKDIFRLTGGTALSSFYLEHRFSDDLDFFSSEKVPFYIPEEFLKTLDFIKGISFTKQFDRNIFNLNLKDGTILKVEFIYYPLKNIEDIVLVDNLKIDSFLDITVNKLCAIADRSEAKDYVDVYSVLKNSEFSLKWLMDLAEKKCEIKGISCILKTRLLQIPEGLENIPLMVDVTRYSIKDFFERLIKEIVVEETLNCNASKPPIPLIH